MSFIDYLTYIINSPLLLLLTILVLGLMIVNGKTDAPNAIATCISTRAIKPKNAIIMAVIFDFLGVFVMSIVGGAVASTMVNMVNFGNNNSLAIVALCVGILSAIVWASASSKFGIPTSESHALIAGLSGAAIAVNNSFSRDKF